MKSHLLRIVAVAGTLLLGLLVLFGSPQERRRPKQYSGVVQSVVGEPLANIEVFAECCPIGFDSDQTGQDGQFQIASVDGVIHFHHPDYRPVTVLMEEHPPDVPVVMEESAETDWLLKDCDQKHRGERRFGEGHVFTVRRGTKYECGRDIDYKLCIIKYESPKGEDILQFWTGPVATNFIPSNKRYLESLTFSQRWIRGSGEPFSIDARGRYQNDKQWRHTGFLGAIYDNVSDEAASLFDRIIDTACTEKPR